MKLNVLIVGIDTYHDSHIPRLGCAVRDAEAVCELFRSIGGETRLLTNTRATSSTIRRGLTHLARSVTADDTAIVYFSGHGGRRGVPGPFRNLACDGGSWTLPKTHSV